MSENLENPKLKSIYDFVTLDNIDILGQRKTQKRVSVVMRSEGKEKYVRFIPIKYLFKYALVGDDITSIEKKFSNYKTLAYYDQVTKLPNAYYLKSDLFEILEDKKSQKNNVLAMVSIVNFNNLHNLFSEKILNDLLLEIKISLKNSVEPYNVKLYNLYYDHFALLFSKEEKFEEINEIILNIMNNINREIGRAHV